MSELQIEYRGYAIHFAENQEVWRCQALDVDGERLATVKAKIDRVIAASRKLDNPVPVIYVDYSYRAKPVEVISLAQPPKDRSGNAQAEPTAAWCMVPERERYFDREKGEYAYRDTKARQKIKLDSLYIDTTENRAALAEAQRLQDKITAATEERKAVLKGMTMVGSGLFKIADPAEEVL